MAAFFSVIVGNVTNDVELKQTNTGKSVCNVNMAVDYSKDHCEFFRCVAWGEQAEQLSRYAKKGSFLILSCKNPNKKTFTSKDGETHDYLEFVVSDWSFGSNMKLDDKPKADKVEKVEKVETPSVYTDESLPF